MDGFYQNQNIQSKGGWILRDWNGAYMGAGQTIGYKVNNAMESELQALLMANGHAALLESRV